MHGPHMRIVATVILVIVTARAAMCYQPQLPAAVRDALVSNAKSLTPVRVILEERYSSSLSAAQLSSQLRLTPPAVERLLRVRTRTFARDGIGMFQRSDELIGSEWETRESSFDGVIYYNGEPTATVSGRSRPELARRLISRLNPDQRLWAVDYLEDAGFDVPRTPRELLNHEPIYSKVLSLLDRGGHLDDISQRRDGDVDGVSLSISSVNPAWQRAAAIDMEAAERELRSYLGKNEEWIQEQLQLLRAKQQGPQTVIHTFVLDPAHHFAVRLVEERYSDGRLIRVIRNSEFEQLSGRNVWLPRASRSDFHTYDSVPDFYSQEPVLVRETTAKSAFDTLPVDPRTFVLSYAMPGTLVIDETLGEQRMVNVGTPAQALGATTDIAPPSSMLPKAKQTGGNNGVVNGPPSGGAGTSKNNRGTAALFTNMSQSWLFCAVVIIALLFIGGYFWKRMSQWLR